MHNVLPRSRLDIPKECRHCSSRAGTVCMQPCPPVPLPISPPAGNFNRTTWRRSDWRAERLLVGPFGPQAVLQHRLAAQSPPCHERCGEPARQVPPARLMLARPPLQLQLPLPPLPGGRRAHTRQWPLPLHKSLPPEPPSLYLCVHWPRAVLERLQQQQQQQHS